MTFEVEPLHDEFGASVTGVDLRGPLDAAQIAGIEDLIDSYSLLRFPGQPFDDESQVAFTRCLGEPEANHVILGQEGRVVYLGTIGNVQPDGSTLGNDHERTIFQTGNNMWHSDSSFREVPSFVSIMCVYEVPDEGGQTLFVSQRAAYGRLTEAEKAEIDPLVAIHDYVFSRSKVSPDAVKPSHGRSLPPVRQRLVRRNPANGRANYYVGSHAKAIEGWDDTSSRRLIEDLEARATAEPHVYTLDWQPGDLVIWDNRCLLHRGVGYDADRNRRYMRQSRVCGAGSTLEEASAGLRVPAGEAR